MFFHKRLFLSNTSYAITLLNENKTFFYKNEYSRMK